MKGTNVRRCVECGMPDTRPGSVFNERGICGACTNYAKRADVDWHARWIQLYDLCHQHRRGDGSYDCIIPVSGGKDSHYQVHVMKNLLGMNPLLLTVGTPFSMTDAGWHNYKNIGRAFNCDHYLFDIGDQTLRKVVRAGLEELGNPFQLIETACYTVSLKVATAFNIPLVVFGENPEYEYGTTDDNLVTSNEYIAKGLPYGIFQSVDFDWWERQGVQNDELNAFMPPSQEALDRVRPEITFLSYFMPWSSTRHLEMARKYGFRDLSHEWKREGFIEDFEQIDCKAYMVHFWLKYPKYGFQRASDVASRYVREGLLDLDTALRLIAENDHKLDQIGLQSFLDFARYDPEEFWGIVDGFYNTDIFEKVGGIWQPK